MPPRILTGLLLVGAALVLQRGLGAAQTPNFDKLDDADRQVLGERFKRDVWPLLVRGGKDGCVGCHNGKVVSALKFSGDADKDFRTLLRDGFFLKDDAGSLLARIEDTNKKRRMPPGDRPLWSDGDKKSLGDLVEAIHQKQKS
jgi:hypothetical protein